MFESPFNSRPESEKLSLGLLGYGLDTARVIEAQMKYFLKLDLERHVGEQGHWFCEFFF